MPSGHAQTAFFSTVFIYLSLKNKYITFAAFNAQLNKKGGAKKKAAAKPKPKRKPWT